MVFSIQSVAGDGNPHATRVPNNGICSSGALGVGFCMMVSVYCK